MEWYFIVLIVIVVIHFGISLLCSLICMCGVLVFWTHQCLLRRNIITCEKFNDRYNKFPWKLNIGGTMICIFFIVITLMGLCMIYFIGFWIAVGIFFIIRWAQVELAKKIKNISEHNKAVGIINHKDYEIIDSKKNSNHQQHNEQPNTNVPVNIKKKNNPKISRINFVKSLNKKYFVTYSCNDRNKLKCWNSKTLKLEHQWTLPLLFITQQQSQWTDRGGFEVHYYTNNIFSFFISDWGLKQDNPSSYATFYNLKSGEIVLSITQPCYCFKLSNTIVGIVKFINQKAFLEFIQIPSMKIVKKETLQIKSRFIWMEKLPQAFIIVYIVQKDSSIRDSMQLNIIICNEQFKAIKIKKFDIKYFSLKHSKRKNEKVLFCEIFCNFVIIKIGRRYFRYNINNNVIDEVNSLKGKFIIRFKEKGYQRLSNDHIMLYERWKNKKEEKWFREVFSFHIFSITKKEIIKSFKKESIYEMCVPLSNQNYAALSINEKDGFFCFIVRNFITGKIKCKLYLNQCIHDKRRCCPRIYPYKTIYKRMSETEFLFLDHYSGINQLTIYLFDVEKRLRKVVYRNYFEYQNCLWVEMMKGSCKEKALIASGENIVVWKINDFLRTRLLLLYWWTETNGLPIEIMRYEIFPYLGFCL